MLRRWDQAVGGTQAPSEGDFYVYDVGGDEYSVYGCVWIVASDRNHVRVECGDGNSIPILDAIELALASYEELGTREILGQQRRCASMEPFEEICIDDDGRPLFIRFGAGAGQHVYEATFVSGEYEGFGWPFDPQTTPEPSTLQQIRPAAPLEFPLEFDLR
jgi:hypothetical protein